MLSQELNIVEQNFAFPSQSDFMPIFELTALSKLKIIVRFLWVSLPVHSGLLKPPGSLLATDRSKAVILV